MNKKVIKIILIISGILLLSGLGIYGYKYIKNKNDDRITNESEVKILHSSSGKYEYDVYYMKAPVNVTSLYGIKCEYGTEEKCSRYIFHGYIIVNNSVKLKSRWVWQYHEEYTTGTPSFNKSSINYAADYNDYILIKPNIVVRYYANSSLQNKTLTIPYAKIFNVKTGDLIYDVPINTNETISGLPSIDGNEWKGNTILTTFSAGYIYYAKPDYDLDSNANIRIYKVSFNEFDENNKPKVEEYGTPVKGTITYGS